MTINENDLFEILGAGRDPAVAIKDGAVVYANTAASGIFHPRMRGKEAELFFPEELLLPMDGPTNMTIDHDGAEYSVTINDVGDLRVLSFLPELPDLNMAKAVADATSMALRDTLAVLCSNLGAVDNFAKSKGDLTVIQSAARIYKAVNQLTRVLDNSQYLFSEEMRPDRLPLDLVRFVGELVVSVNAMTSPDQPKITVTGDPQVLPYRFDMDLMDLALLNIFSNSLKYTPNGGAIDVNIRSVRAGVLITVKDSGTGVPMGEMNDMFSAYERLHSINSYGCGLGAGLNIARRVLSAHGGSVMITSRQGHGAEVTLRLPPSDVRPDEPIQSSFDRSYSSLLTELADVLPDTTFQLIDM